MLDLLLVQTHKLKLSQLQVGSSSVWFCLKCQ